MTWRAPQKRSVQWASWLSHRASPLKPPASLALTVNDSPTGSPSPLDDATAFKIEWACIPPTNSLS